MTASKQLTVLTTNNTKSLTLPRELKEPFPVSKNTHRPHPVFSHCQTPEKSDVGPLMPI